MKLKRDTVKAALIEFGEFYGWPKHLDTDEKKSRFIDIFHKRLAEVFTEETFPDALTIAWHKTRFFPTPEAFHRGYEIPQTLAEKERNGFRGVSL